MLDKNDILIIPVPSGTSIDNKRIMDLGGKYEVDDIKVYFFDGDFNDALVRIGKWLSIKETESGKYYSCVILVHYEEIWGKIDNIHNKINREDEVAIHTSHMDYSDERRNVIPNITTRIIVTNSLNFKLIASFHCMSRLISFKYQDPYDESFILYNQLKNANLHIIPLNDWDNFIPIKYTK